MLHKHHSTHHLLGSIVGILFLGSVLGGMSGLMGKTVIRPSGAAGAIARSAERQSQMLQNRLDRRLERLQRIEQEERRTPDVGTTYPMQQNTFAYKNRTDWGVELGTAVLSFDRLGILAPIGRPPLSTWNARNWRSLEDQMQYLLLNGLAVYPHSPNPGELGRYIVAGHSSPPTIEAIGSPYEDIFSTLPEAHIGDRITVRDAEGRDTVFRVTKTQVVPATYTQILLQDPSVRQIILFTCYPVGTTRERFVVWGDVVTESDVMAAR